MKKLKVKVIPNHIASSCAVFVIYRPILFGLFYREIGRLTSRRQLDTFTATFRGWDGEFIRKLT